MSAPSNHPQSGLPRLRVELVPSTCLLSNVCSSMRERAWKRLAREVAEDGLECCEVCGGRGVQLLMRLQALCPDATASST